MAKPLPDIEIIKDLYSSKKSIKAVATYLHVAKWRVQQALFLAGILDHSGKKPASAERPYKDSICNTCRYAYALACSFIRAPREEAEAVLIKAGCEYHHGSEKQIKIFKCPKHKPGNLPTWKGIPSAKGGSIAQLRYPHSKGGQ